MTKTEIEKLINKTENLIKQYEHDSLFLLQLKSFLHHLKELLKNDN